MSLTRDEFKEKLESLKAGLEYLQPDQPPVGRPIDRQLVENISNLLIKPDKEFDCLIIGSQGEGFGNELRNFLEHYRRRIQTEEVPNEDERNFAIELDEVIADLATYRAEELNKKTQLIREAETLNDRVEKLLKAAADNEVIRKQLHTANLVSRLTAANQALLDSSYREEADVTFISEKLEALINNLNRPGGINAAHYTHEVETYDVVAGNNPPTAKAYEETLKQKLIDKFQAPPAPNQTFTQLEMTGFPADKKDITNQKFHINYIYFDRDQNPDYKNTAVFTERLAENNTPRSEIKNLPDNINPAKFFEAAASNPALDASVFQSIIDEIKLYGGNLNAATLLEYGEKHGLNETIAKRCMEKYKSCMTQQYHGYTYPHTDVIQLAMRQVESFRALYGDKIPMTITASWSREYVHAALLYCASHTPEYKIRNESKFSIPENQYKDDAEAHWSGLDSFTNKVQTQFKALIQSDPASTLNVLYEAAKKKNLNLVEAEQIRTQEQGNPQPLLRR